MKLLRSIFARPFTYLKNLMPEFRQLRLSLENLPNNEPIDNLVHLFNIVSPWHDRSLNDLKEKFSLKSNAKSQKTLALIGELSLHMKNAGRCEFGINRTKSGEQVTLDDVYLGDIYGLWTKTARFWLEKKNNKKGGWGFPNMENLNAYDVISNKASNFINSHRGRMIELINELELVVQ